MNYIDKHHLENYNDEQAKNKNEEYIRKINRNIRINLDEQFKQLEVLKSNPIYVAVPTGERCNLSCIFCIERHNLDTNYSDLTLDQFLQFISPIEKASRVQIYGWGEPFFNPNYEKIFDYIIEHYKGIRVHISTNGTLLTDKWINKLLTYGKCILNFSINAASPETYIKVTKHNLFDCVKDNISRLMKKKRQRQINDFVVTLSFVTIKTNIQELPSFIELCAELGIRHAKLLDLNFLRENHSQLFIGDNAEYVRKVFLKAHEIALTRGVCIDTFINSPVSYFKQDRSVYSYSDLPYDLKPVWMQSNDVKFYPRLGECYEPWQTFMITQSGNVYTCCRGRDIMGNIKEQRWEEIWNGKKYCTYRRSINSSQPPKACRMCPVKMRYSIR